SPSVFTQRASFSFRAALSSSIWSACVFFKADPDWDGECVAGLRLFCIAHLLLPRRLWLVELLYLMKSRNSLRVLLSLLKRPSMQLVMVLLFCFWTPRIIMH